MIRPARPADADAVAVVFLAARAEGAAAGTIAPVTDEQDARRYLTGLVSRDEVWVAEQAGRVVAMTALTPGWLEHLYVHPDQAGIGIGSDLVEFAKTRLGTVQLWTFQANTPARAFYARRGFVEMEFTDGAANMEPAPDVRLQWPGTTALNDPSMTGGPQSPGGVLPRLHRVP